MFKAKLLDSVARGDVKAVVIERRRAGVRVLRKDLKEETWRDGTYEDPGYPVCIDKLKRVEEVATGRRGTVTGAGSAGTEPWNYDVTWDDFSQSFFVNLNTLRRAKARD